MNAFLLAALLTSSASTACVGESSDEPSKGQAKRSDFYGDPLPEGAIARLGSSQLRHPGASLHFSADGKQLVSWGRDRLLRTWDVATGKLLRQEALHPLDSAESGWFLAGDRIVQIVGQTLHVREAKTGKALRKIALAEKIVARALPKPAKPAVCHLLEGGAARRTALLNHFGLDSTTHQRQPPPGP